MEKDGMNIGFVCINQNDSSILVDEILEFNVDGACQSKWLEINNALLPEKLREGKRPENIPEGIMQGDVFYCQIGEKKLLSGRGFWHGDNPNDIYGHDAIKKIFRSLDTGKNSSVIDITTCTYIENIDSVDHNGVLLDKDFKPADPQYNDCIVFRTFYPMADQYTVEDYLYPKKTDEFIIATPYLAPYSVSQDELQLPENILPVLKEKEENTIFARIGEDGKYHFVIAYSNDGSRIEENNQQSENHNISELPGTVSDRLFNNIAQMNSTISQEINREKAPQATTPSEDIIEGQ